MEAHETRRVAGSPSLRAWVSVLIAASALWFVYLHFADPGLLGWLTHEDSVTETLSAALYLLAAGLFLVLWIRRGFSRVFILGYALLFLVVGGEEISWGQRLLGLETPETLDEINVQGETNLHNIDGIHQHVRMAGLLVVLLIAFIMPLAQRFVPFFARLFKALSVPVVPLWTVPITVLAVVFMVAPRVAGIPAFRFDEVGELYLSVTFAMFALEEWRARSAVLP